MAPGYSGERPVPSHASDSTAVATLSALHQSVHHLILISIGNTGIRNSCVLLTLFPDLHVQAVPQAADRDGRGRAHHLQEPEGSVHSVHRGEAPSLSSGYYSI